MVKKEEERRQAAKSERPEPRHVGDIKYAEKNHRVTCGWTKLSSTIKTKVDRYSVISGVSVLGVLFSPSYLQLEEAVACYQKTKSIYVLCLEVLCFHLDTYLQLEEVVVHDSLVGRLGVLELGNLPGLVVHYADSAIGAPDRQHT